MKRLVLMVLGLGLAAAGVASYAPDAHALRTSIGIGSSTSCYRCGSESKCESDPSGSMSCEDGNTGGMQWCEVSYPDEGSGCTKDSGSGAFGYVLVIW